MRLRLFAVSSLVVLAGCASSSPAPSSSAPSSAPSASSSPSSPPSSSPPSSPLSSTSSSPSSSPSSEIISGTVSAGVEPHCLILRDAAGSHSLYFHDESLRSSAPAGAHVTLVGHAEPRMMTTCQQGEPFIVTAVRPN